MSLNKQIWTDQIMQHFYPDASFLKYAKDMSEHVSYDKINLADAGIDPNVTKDAGVYPIPIVDRTDTALELSLNLYESENTIVQDATITEVSYNKMESVVFGHRNKLTERTGKEAAYSYSPAANTTATPILKTTGETNALGYKKMLPEDIVTLMEQWNSLNYPLDGRYLVLDPRHLGDLIRFDLKYFGNITNIKDAQLNQFAGFNILSYSNPALYKLSDLTKKPYGSVADSTTTFGSFAFVGSEVMKADGTIDMYARLKDPEYRGDIVGFSKRFLAMPIRNKGISAIVSDKS